MATVIFKTLGGKAEIHCGANSPKEAFKTLATLQELFSEEVCGCCKSPNIAFGVRTTKNQQNIDCDYYEMRCHDCGAQLSFGQHVNTPTLFKKNWDKEARAPMPNGGWYIYQPNQQHGGGDGNYQSPNYQQPNQQGGGYQQPQQGGGQQQRPQQRQQGPPSQQGPPMGAPPPQGGDIPFSFLVPFIGLAASVMGMMS